ncbi:DMT family transporter [Abyssalbus ytuae]|uniref:DMT family transporter n=1 Tax=Abyssalbus ytuae TaxID=2926907 RepID=A0A9E6ZL42_9FLAO|nr:DMT family transporter [Abyssalbus ytuae]UOB16235.1 DMT family transporter [Abyssalbus ytuae]
MNDQNKKWLYFIILSLIWGSSFILIKKGLVGLTSIQLGALRIFFTSVLLFSIGLGSLKEVKKEDWKWIFLSGLVGSGFPPFLFAIAQTRVDSAVASILNSLTPLNTFILGMLFFGFFLNRKQIFGVILGFIGTFILIASGQEIGTSDNYWYSFLIIIASVGYALNANIIKSHLSNVNALAITTGNFIFLIVPAVILLWYTGFFKTVFASPEMQTSVLYVFILSLFGTAMAKVFYNKLIQIASPVFASSVTYTMTLVAVLWGFLDGEKLSFYQLLGGAIILAGVYLSKRT